jgi:hypothetical protein
MAEQGESSGAGAAGAPGTGARPPNEEELQRQLEEQLRKVRVQDLLLESVVSILNLSARRIGKEDERDLEQARIGIDAVRAVLELIDEGPRAQVREALSQVQMLYANAAQGGAKPSAEGAEAPSTGAPAGAEQPAEGRSEAGPRQPPPGLWVPPGSS